MKKKHLHGKLSLKIKDLSAMNGQAKQAIGGGLTQPCTKDWSNCAECEDPTMATCQGGDTCDQTCNTCAGQLSCIACHPTTPEVTCNTQEADCYTNQGPSACAPCGITQYTCAGQPGC